MQKVYSFFSSSVTQLGRVVERLQPCHAGVSEVEVIIQHGLLIVQDGEGDGPGQVTAVVGHDLGANGGGGVVVGELDVKLRHHAGLDVLQHHICPQVCAVVDVPRPSQLGPVVLVLDGAGADDPHIVGLNLRVGSDVAHTGYFHIFPVYCDKDFALGAYYAYTAFCESAGLKAEPLSKFESGEYTGFLGSLYSAIKAYPQSQALADNPDTVQFWRPFVDLDTKWYPDAEFSMEYFGGTLCKVDDTSNKYLTFLGGDHPITVIKTNVDGPVCMILKESYGNAFTPWLTSHYSKIIAIDPREFNRDGKPSLDLAAFAKEQGVNDCIVLDYPIMLNSDSYITWLERLVD